MNSYISVFSWCEIKPDLFNKIKHYKTDLVKTILKLISLYIYILFKKLILNHNFLHSLFKIFFKRE